MYVLAIWLIFALNKQDKYLNTMNLTKIIVALALQNIVYGAVVAQIPAGYYQSASGKSGQELKTALYSKIYQHTECTYKELWTHFQTTDSRDDGKVWDVYSHCDFAFTTGQCGNYSKICDCYNREHSFPKSWFNDATPMYTDIFHMYPTDGYTNGRRGNYPFGEVGTVTWSDVSARGKLGSAKGDLGYSGVVFEPDDEYKGDFARTYFYMVTCYESQVAGWVSNNEAKPMLNGTSYPAFTEWAQRMLLKWHRLDPVTPKEVNRNNAIYQHVQHNRNPFIDHPELVEYVWGDSIGKSWHSSADTLPGEVTAVSPLGMEGDFLLYPNPAHGEVYVAASDGATARQVVELYNVGGQMLRRMAMPADGSALRIDLQHLPEGIYLVRMVGSKGEAVRKLRLAR
jgi:endonuclease I